MPKSNHPSRSVRFLVILATAAALGGCAINRTVAAPVNLGPPLDSKTTSVVVSSFYEGEYRASMTGSLDIQIIRESMEVRDMSLEVSQALREVGISAAPKRGFSAKDLAPGQLLISGVAMFRKRDPNLMARAVVSGMTCFIFGGILPFPVPMSYSCDHAYRVEIVNGAGDVLLSTRAKDFSVRYGSLYIPTPGCDRDKETNRQEFVRQLALEIKRVIAPN
jgi:hypothetical protein